MNQKQMCHFDFCNIFGFCWPIFTSTIRNDHTYIE